jgi:hypothetical protein
MPGGADRQRCHSGDSGTSPKATTVDKDSELTRQGAATTAWPARCAAVSAVPHYTLTRVQDPLLSQRGRGRAPHRLNSLSNNSLGMVSV